MTQDADITAAGGLDKGDMEVHPHSVRRNPWLEGGKAVVRQGLGKASDVIKGLVEGLVALVQHLHDTVGVDDEVRPALSAQIQPVRQLAGEGDIKDAVVQNLLRLVVVDDPDGAQPGGGVEEMGELLWLLYKEADLELLPAAAVLLGAEVGDVEVVLGDELQDAGDAAGPVPELELHQQHAGGPAALEVADLPQFLGGQRQPLRLPVGLDEEGVDVDGLVIAHPGDVEAQGRHASAGLEKGPHVVRHGGDVGLLHALTPPGKGP